MAFVFTRAPGTKTQASVVSNSLVNALNNLVIIGHMAQTGSTATAYRPYQVTNFGDPVAVVTELAAQFGANSEISSMVVAAINGVLESNLTTVAYPAITVIPLAYADTSSSLGATLQGLLTLQAPFIAHPYPGSDAVAQTALKAYVTEISGQSRGRYGQFGSFCFTGVIATLGAATPIGLAGASPNMLYPWMIDSAGTPANSVAQISAATAAACAANGLPFLPMTDVVVGGLRAQASTADYHTPDDTGTEALGLNAGLIPLMTNLDGTISISRTVTSSVRVTGQVDADYFDLQDWQVLYYIRQVAYNLAQQPQYKIARASAQKAKALMSDILGACHKMEDDLEMLQGVKESAGDFVATLSSTNRAAWIYTIPVDVVPGFYNKGIQINGTNAYDVLTA